MCATCFTSVGAPICISSSSSSSSFSAFPKRLSYRTNNLSAGDYMNLRELKKLDVPNICEIYLRPFNMPFTVDMFEGLDNKNTKNTFNKFQIALWSSIDNKKRAQDYNQYRATLTIYKNERGSSQGLKCWSESFCNMNITMWLQEE